MSVRACVIFDSRYGNTEKIAKAFETGLKEAGIQTLCINAREVSLESLKEYDMIAVGAPTEKVTASKSIKEFLEKLRTIDLSGRFGFAFDTKLPYPLTGSAAKYIEKELKKSRLEIVMPRDSAIVVVEKEKGGDVKLKEGEEKRFEEVGHQAGTALLTRERTITA